MRNTINNLKQKAVVWVVGITLAAIPLSAFAAYVKSPGDPIVKELDGTDTRTGEYKIVGTITIPQTKMDNFLNGVVKVLSSKEKSKKPLTLEEQQIATLKGEILGREMMIAKLKEQSK